MDYDKTEIASVYDRARALSTQQLQRWLDLVARDARPAPGALIVDLGCGTGRFCKPLAERFSARVIGVEPSAKMLEEARRKTGSDRVEFHRAGGERIPLVAGTVDVVFMSMAFHHLADPGAALRECRRILRRGGHFCLRNVTRECDFPHRHFFPSVARALPARRDVEGAFAAADFAPVAHQTLTQPVAANWPELMRKLALRAYSTLARLSDSEFEAGMAALSAHSPAGGPDRQVCEEIDWYVFRAP
jgi:ubiquinone/menaquinone biosynthesis C-methylase UbiE